jgi:hypothetical protein
MIVQSTDYKVIAVQATELSVEGENLVKYFSCDPARVGSLLSLPIAFSKGVHGWIL